MPVPLDRTPDAASAAPGAGLRVPRAGGDMFDVDNPPTVGPAQSLGPPVEAAAAAPGRPGRPLIPGTDKRRCLRKCDVIGQSAAQNKGLTVNDPGHMSERTREQIQFEDNVVKTLPSAMLDMLKRIHINLGHPSGPDLYGTPLWR